VSGLSYLYFVSLKRIFFSGKLSKAHRADILVIEEITMEIKPHRGGILFRENFEMLSVFSFNVLKCRPSGAEGLFLSFCFTKMSPLWGF
jgi:hypothetical protein